jgi:hypothetical protein
MLVDTGFLDDNGVLQVHDWADYGGKLLERRERNAEQMRRARARRKAASTHMGAPPGFASWLLAASAATSNSRLPRAGGSSWTCCIRSSLFTTNMCIPTSPVRASSATA